MESRNIPKNVERRLFAESMGKCMNPACQKDLFTYSGDIAKKAHIIEHYKTADNSFENLILLCPNCHTNFDKNQAFNKETVLEWKRIRREQVEKFFCKKFNSFDELKEQVHPLLSENKGVYENYYISGKKELWDKFEYKILINNKKLKHLLSSNYHLIQQSYEEKYSNLAYVEKFIIHINEFELTRSDKEKIRSVLFPKEINSMFGVSPVDGDILNMTSSIECLIDKFKAVNKFQGIILGVDKPYLEIIDDNESSKIYLDDVPRLRQYFNDYNCFRKNKFNLSSLNYVLKFLRSKKIDFQLVNETNLREFIVDSIKIIFVYEYCLSYEFLIRFSPQDGCVVVNLHRWNGDGCITSEARELAKDMNIQLMTLKEFYKYVNKLRSNVY